MCVCVCVCVLDVSFLSTAVDCSALTNPANGQVSHPDGTTFGQTATYSCNTGYNLVGDMQYSHMSSYRELVWECTYLSKYVVYQVVLGNVVIG